MRLRMIPPVESSESRIFDFGYTLPRLLGDGEEYYNWDISVRHFDFSGEIEFEDDWEVIYARWDKNISTVADPVEWEKNRISWEVQFPEVGERMKIIMELKK
jgi:hypothetical protein